MRRQHRGSTSGRCQAIGRSARKMPFSTRKAAALSTGSMRATCIWFSDPPRTAGQCGSASPLTARPPGNSHGTDIDADGYGTVSGQRLYQLVRQGSAIADRTFEIEFLDPSVYAYAFTFG